MQEFDECHNIRVGDEVSVTQIFDDYIDRLESDPVKFAASMVNSLYGTKGEVETRTGIIESIDDLDAGLFGITFHFRLPNGKIYGATIEQLRPDGCLMVLGEERL